MDELVERVRLALAAQYPGAPNGRVRDVPDRRAIRWYATTGLVDRPAAMRGRTALYGRRHLLQLVALKRRQADGRTLAEIQAELAGATDATLAGIAQVPDDLLVGGDPPDGTVETVRARFWAGAPAAAPTPTPTPTPAVTTPAAATVRTPAVRPPARIDSVWTGPLSMTFADEGPAPVHHAQAVPLSGVALGGGAVLLLPGRPADDDYAAITTAAAPLVDLLAARGLLAAAGPLPPHDLPAGGVSPTNAGAPANPGPGPLAHHDGSSR